MGITAASPDAMEDTINVGDDEDSCMASPKTTSLSPSAIATPIKDFGEEGDETPMSSTPTPTRTGGGLHGRSLQQAVSTRALSGKLGGDRELSICLQTPLGRIVRSSSVIPTYMESTMAATPPAVDASSVMLDSGSSKANARRAAMMIMRGSSGSGTG